MNEAIFFVTGFVGGFVITSIVWVSFISKRIKQMQKRLVDFIEDKE